MRTRGTKEINQHAPFHDDMDDEETIAKKFKHSVISDHVFSADFQEIFCTYWHNFKPLKMKNLEIISTPFRVAKISNFLRNEEFIDAMKNELSLVRSIRNCTDLYQFEQTDDLESIQSTNVKLLYETFQTDLLFWMERSMSIKLNNVMSMSSACYSDTDYLLCHDDNLGDRRIAFVLYLSKNWTVEDGGTFDLFDTDEKGFPRSVVQSIVPEYNSLLFFEVVHNSYHQVAEVISPDKVRWSINGWWHGLEKESNLPPRSELFGRFIRPKDTVVDLSEWIAECYLVPKIIKQIQEDLEQESFAFLSNFLKEEVYNALSVDVISDQIHWERVGPADIRNYEVAKESTLPIYLRAFLNVFGSIVFFRLVKEYTELDVVPDDERTTPRMSIELQRWSKGCYTLIYDISTPNSDTSNTECAEDTRDNEIDSEHEYDASSESSKISKLSDTEKKCSLIELEKKINTECIPEPASNATPSSTEDEVEEKKVPRKVIEEEKVPQKVVEEEKSPQKTSKDSDIVPASCSKTEDSSPMKLPRTVDSEDPDVSDIGEYLSGPSDHEEEKEDSAELHTAELGVLDVIMQFHTDKLSDDETIDYVNSRERDGTLIQVPCKNNYFCMVYKPSDISRVHKSQADQSRMDGKGWGSLSRVRIYGMFV